MRTRLEWGTCLVFASGAAGHTCNGQLVPPTVTQNSSTGNVNISYMPFAPVVGDKAVSVVRENVGGLGHKVERTVASR